MLRTKVKIPSKKKPGYMHEIGSQVTLLDRIRNGVWSIELKIPESPLRDVEHIALSQLYWEPDETQ